MAELLEHLQTNRKAALQSAIEEAVAMEQAAERPRPRSRATNRTRESNTAPADTTEPFRPRNFDFSKTQIAVLIALYRRMNPVDRGDLRPVPVVKNASGRDRAA